MAFNNHNDSSDNEWEIVGDEITPIAASQNNDITITKAIPGGAEREPSLATDAPDDRNGDRQDENRSFISGVSSLARDHHSVENGEGDVHNEDSDTLDGEQEPAGAPSDSPESLVGCDEELPAKLFGVGEETKDDAGGADELLTPSSLAAAKPDASSTPSAAEGADPLAPTPSVADTSNSRTASPPAVSAPAAGSPEVNREEETSESAGFVDSLSGMGFEKEPVKKAMDDLREAGSEIDADSVIAEMTGEIKVDGRTWEFIRSAAQDFEQQHELRRRTQNCVNTVGHSARELLSAAKEESQRFSESFRETCDEADVRARTASTQAKYAASSAKDSICRANEEYRISEKVATVAVVGAALLIALGNPRAGVGVMAMAGSSVAVGEAMKHAAAHSTSTQTRDHGLSEGLHLD